MKMEDFWVECNVCKQRYKNHAGSTECCGSIAYIIDEYGNPTTSAMFYAKIEEKDESREESS